MKRPTLLRGALVALILSALGSVLFTALSLTMSSAIALRLVITLTAAAYTFYLLSISTERTGRWVTLSLCVIGTLGTWALWPSLFEFTLAHAIGIWLIRSLYLHGRPLTAAIDLGLSMLALAAAITTTVHTGSLMLTLWCYFLTQAAFVLIPGGSTKQPQAATDDRFNRAYRTAESAARRIVTH